MNDAKNNETSSGSTQKSYQLEPIEPRGYMPLTHTPKGKQASFTPPPGSGAPSGGGEPPAESQGGGESGTGSEKK